MSQKGDRVEGRCGEKKGDAEKEANGSEEEISSNFSVGVGGATYKLPEVAAGRQIREVGEGDHGREAYLAVCGC